jgi:hypothetical protein
MSSRLCKNLEGAVSPLQVEPVKDRIDNPIHTLNIHKTNHRPGAPPHLDKATLDHIGGA